MQLPTRVWGRGPGKLWNVPNKLHLVKISFKFPRVFSVEWPPRPGLSRTVPKSCSPCSPSVLGRHLRQAPQAALSPPHACQRCSPVAASFSCFSRPSELLQALPARPGLLSARPSPRPELPGARGLPTLCWSHLGGLSQWVPLQYTLARPTDSGSHRRPPQGLILPHCLSRPAQASGHRSRNPSSFLANGKLFPGKECLPPLCLSAESLQRAPHRFRAPRKSRELQHGVNSS